MDTFHLHKWKINTSGGQSGLGPGPVSAALQWRQATRLLLSVEQDSDGEMSLFKQKECVLASVAGISFLTPDGARHVKTSGGCCSRSLSEQGGSRLAGNTHYTDKEGREEQMLSGQACCSWCICLVRVRPCPLGPTALAYTLLPAERPCVHVQATLHISLVHVIG